MMMSCAINPVEETNGGTVVVAENRRNQCGSGKVRGSRRKGIENRKVIEERRRRIIDLCEDCQRGRLIFKCVLYNGHKTKPRRRESKKSKEKVKRNRKESSGKN